MSDVAVPVTMGSPRFGTWHTESALVTLLSFPGRAVLDAHMHDRPTFAVILDGGFDLMLTGQTKRNGSLSCPAGTIVTQPAGERHVNHIGRAGAHGVVLQPHATGKSLPPSCARLLNGINHFRDGRIAVAARSVACEMVSPDDVTPFAIEGLVLEMLATAARLEETACPSRANAPRWLNVATDFVHAHFRDHIRVASVAAAAGVHPAHLAAIFRRFHRLPLAAYVRRLRVEWVADRLVSTDAPISMIALEAGFADQAHLTRWFQRTMGWSPGAYRRVHRS